MHKVLIVGAGKIGSLIAHLLGIAKDYQIYLADINPINPDLKRIEAKTPNLQIVALDVLSSFAVKEFLRLHPVDALISCLPFHCTEQAAHIAKENNLHYFDLTEDTKTTETINQLAKDGKNIFVPQCGLAPGFISIVANHLMQHFNEIDMVKMRVGALPTNISNALQYSLTWSTDGVINEYGNLCRAIECGKEIETMPLEGLEEIKIDGLTYEAFNTSGGIGSLTQTYLGRANSMNYKTIRYPGHCEKMRFLMNELKLNSQRDILKKILENVIPKTYQDVVLVYVSVTGKQDGQFIEENYVKKFYAAKMNGVTWSAIQLTTATSMCAVVDLVLNNLQHYQGVVRQEQFSFEDFADNRFGQFYSQQKVFTVFAEN